MRVSASSVISSVPDTRATPASWRRVGAGSDSKLAGRPFIAEECTIQPHGHARREEVVMIAFRRAFVVAAVLWAVALPLATFAAARRRRGGAAVRVRVRRVRLRPRALPSAARALVSPLGLADAGLRALRGHLSRRRRRPPSAASVRPRPGCRRAASARPRGSRSRSPRLPALATLVYEWTTGQMPANWIRAATGVCSAPSWRGWSLR